MTLHRHARGALLALPLIFLLWPTGATAHTCDDPFSTDLLTARGVDVGDVKVCNDAEFLTVTYETTFPWCVLRTHLHSALVEDPADPAAGIPRTRLGTPWWPKFDYRDRHDCVGEVPFVIALADIEAVAGDTVAIAARVIVEGDGADWQHPRCLLGDKCVAWGDGPRFRRRLPATYFTYQVQGGQTGCGGSTSKCVFVTSDVFQGNLVAEAADLIGPTAPTTGSAAGDAICQTFAEAESSLVAPGSYKAWLSDDQGSPSTRFNQPDVPYALPSGDLIADSYDILVTNGPSIPLDETESGGSPLNDRVWTGTGLAGEPISPRCSEWTNISVGNGRVGRTNRVDNAWTSGGDLPCDQRAQLYCFQQ